MTAPEWIIGPSLPTGSPAATVSFGLNARTHQGGTATLTVPAAYLTGDMAFQETSSSWGDFSAWGGSAAGLTDNPGANINHPLQYSFMMTFQAEERGCRRTVCTCIGAAFAGLKKI